MGKDMGIRYAGTQDTLCLFNCALELLASPALESEQELLELVKKVKCDADKYHPPAPTAVKKPSCKYYCLSLLSFSLLFPEFFFVFFGPFVERRLSSTKLLGSV
jgi:hypothetical protein